MKDKLPLFIVMVLVVVGSFIAMGATIVGNVEIEENQTMEESLLGQISGMQLVSADLYPGESIDSFIDVVNTVGDTAILRANISGNVAKFIEIRNPVIKLKPGERSNVNLTISVPYDTVSGVYSGVLSLRLDGKSVNIPANVRVLQPTEPLLSIDVQLLMDKISPGKKLPVQVTIYNPHKIERSTELTLQLIDPLSKEILNETRTYPFIDRTKTLTLNLGIPKDITVSKIEGDRYLVRAALSYEESANRTKEIEDIGEITIGVSIWQFKIFGIPIWAIPIIFFLFACAILGYVLYKRSQAQKKRYLASIDFMSLPKAGSRSAFIGKISESGIRAFIELDRLMEHCLIAGSTGGGKTVAAQDIVEEALLNDIAVLVFDPTAQWTGFLRPNRDRRMFALYPKFEMKKKDARGFNGSIKIINPPIREFDVRKYMNPGEITIFCLNRLDPEQIEELVVEVILSVFRATLDESTKLKTLIVFDEVHRLLPKFGGTGKGLTQLERGVREFRKWGVGLILISQVLSDFPKDVEANVATEIQMRTRYEGDLNRIKMKYGEDIMRSVVKAQVGTGMLQNSQYNHGRPYFVTFRPLLHHPRRLSDKELEIYEKYDIRIELLKNLLEDAKRAGLDVFDLELELDLALSNLKKGSFDIVDMYLESLEPRIRKLAEEGKEGEVVEEVGGESTSLGDTSGSDFDNDLRAIMKEVHRGVNKEK